MEPPAVVVAVGVGFRPGGARRPPGAARHHATAAHLAAAARARLVKRDTTTHG